jgi:hypothetical protein
VPAGTLPVAAGFALATAGLLAADALRGAGAAAVDVDVVPDLVAAHVLLPLVVARATGTEPPAQPSAPWPTVDGAVCADLGAGDDRESFARLLDVLTLGADRPRGKTDRPPGKEELACAAQEWRLPVTPYRRRRPGCRTAPVIALDDSAPTAAGSRPRFDVDSTVGPSVRPSPASPLASPLAPPLASLLAQPLASPLRGFTVVDLTVMWAGPLCTRLLGDLGARVVKVEPDCRLDGTRFSPGAALYRALNVGKERAPLDLRAEADRKVFFDLVAASDLVVDNFSPRVAPNLGIDPAALRAVNPTIATLSLPAFPPGPHRHWVSYGTGVHALSGLGDVGEGGDPHAPAVTYPDPLAGLAGLVAAVALLLAGRDGRRHGHAPARAASAEVSLARALGPLVEIGDPEPLVRPVDDLLVARLAEQWTSVPAAPYRLAAVGSAPRSREAVAGGR